MASRNITITLGKHEAETRKAALERIAVEVSAIGYHGEASVSTLIQMIADGDLEVKMAKKAILVDNDRGQYDIHLGARRVPWNVIKGQAERVEKVEDLRGWGEWKEVYRVDGVQYYFVS